MSYSFGIHYDIPNDVYHNEIDAYSSTFIKTAALKSLAHAKHGKGFISSSVADMGSAVHALLLEPEKELIHCGPETRRGNAWKDAQAEAEAAGAILLPEKDFDLAHDIARGMMQNPDARAILTDEARVCEASIIVKDPDTGLKLKVRPDVYIEDDGIMADVKTTASANPRDFARQAWSLGYPIQAAFYLKCAQLAGISVDKFYFLAVEKEPPFASQVFEVSQYAIQYGLRVIDETLAKIAIAEKTGDWGTGWEGVSTLDVPAWMQQEESDDGHI